MLKHIQKLKSEILFEYFKEKKVSLSHPLLFAIDIDRTIVDRENGAHTISDQVKQMFDHLRNDPHFIVAVNTGRDYSSYHPIQQQLSHKTPCLFLSGRVLHLSNEAITFSSAIIPSLFCSILWKKLTSGVIRFIDAKHEWGNTIFEINDQSRSYWGLFKPSDWYNFIPQMISNSEEHYYSLKIVRFEIPVFKKDFPALFHSIKNNNREDVNQLAHDLFDSNEFDLHFIPVNVHASRNDYKDEIAYLRIIVNTHRVNKGTGLKELMNHLSIPETNIICFGDSSSDTASDAVIKQALPNVTLCITENGDSTAISYADFLIKPVRENGVPKAVTLIAKTFKRIIKASH